MANIKFSGQNFLLKYTGGLQYHTYEWIPGKFLRGSQINLTTTIYIYIYFKI